MDRPQIALVCPDETLRVLAAAAFDDAPPEWEVSLHRQAPAEAEVMVGVGPDVAGDVILDPRDPRRVIHDVQSALSAARTRTIAVCGASGGCGATSVALHLAAHGDASTCLVDLADPRCCATRLGLDGADLDAAGGPVPVAGGFRLWGPRDIDTVSESVALSGFDRVIFDIGSRDLERVAPGCDSVVVVMSPTPVSAAHAARLLEVVGDTPSAVVTNRLGPGGETTRAELQRILGRRITLELPCSRGLRDAESDARLFSSAWSPWLLRIARLSAALAR